MSVSALYLHVPFCARKCLYCDFASWATTAGDELVVSYERALERQVGELAEAGLLGDVETAYVGGGTPSLLGERLVDLVECVGAAASPAELTCEANPESLGDDLLSSLDASWLHAFFWITSPSVSSRTSARTEPESSIVSGMVMVNTRCTASFVESPSVARQLWILTHPVAFVSHSCSVQGAAAAPSPRFVTT